MDTKDKIEAVLFWKAEPIALQKLCEIIKEDREVTLAGLAKLEDSLKNRGLCLVRKDDEVALATAPQSSSFIEQLTKEELSRDIGKSGLETLTIILYCGPISRRDIDYIRGVNSTFIIRNLLIRALIEKVEDSKDQRIFLYRASFELLAFMGIEKINMLPDYDKMRSEFISFKNAREGSDRAGDSAMSKSDLAENPEPFEVDNDKDETTN
jgi:segregation and condensation protein B